MTDIKMGTVLFYKLGHRTREDWREHVVIGETKLSWLLGDVRWPSKVNKKTLLESNKGYSPTQWYTAEAAKDFDFVEKNRHHIAGAVHACKDVTVLRLIASALGMEEQK